MAETRLTSLGVMILALLREGDMHPYEMMRLMRQRRVDRLVGIAKGTVYHTVSRLESQGLLAEIGVDRDGRRPERTTYSLRPEGAAALVAWVERELPRIDRPAEFRVAVREAHNLDRDTVEILLRERRALLADDLDEHRTDVAEARAKGVPEQFLIEMDRAIVLLGTELAWLDGLLDRFDHHELPWGVPDVGTPEQTSSGLRKAVMT